MTVGNLFIIVLVTIILIHIVAYILYRKEYKRLKKHGYHEPEKESPFYYHVACVSFGTVILAIAVWVLCAVVMNWNTPITI